MKKIIFVIQFFAIFSIFILSPIIQQFSLNLDHDQPLNLNYGLVTYLYGIVSYIIYLQCMELFGKDLKHVSFFEKFFLYSKEGLICFGLLSALFAFFSFLNLFFEIDVYKTVNIEKNAFAFFKLITGTFCAAFYEETIFRFFAPESILHFLKSRSINMDENINSGKDCSDCSILKRKMRYMFDCLFITRNIDLFSSFSRIKIAAIEIFCIVLFSCGHIYLGFLAVINAFFAGIILRRCYIKTRSLFLCVSIHFLYNFLVIILGSIL